MTEEKSKKRAGKKTKSEIQNQIEAEKILFKKVEKAEEVDEKKEEEFKPNEKTVQKESKTLRNLLLVLVLIAAVIGFIIVLNISSKNFTVDGVKYTVVQQGQLTFYNTQIPVIYQGKLTNYNFYLYNNPSVIQNKIPFNGNISVVQGMILSVNVTNKLACNGDAVLGIANLFTLYTLIGNVTNGANSTCDPSGGHVFVNIQESNQTDIQQTAPYCYNINVNNCQVLAATERYMTETFAKIHNLSSG